MSFGTTPKFILYNKEIGYSFTNISKYFKDNYSFIKKLCYSGRLDPMASGLMLLPLNENCSKNDNYIQMDKIYNFTLIISKYKTDTYDILGINSLVNYDNIDDNIIIEKVKNIVENYPKEIDQEYPPFSSIPIKINGVRKPLWEWTKYNHECIDKVEIPTLIKKVKIYDLKINEIKIIQNNELLEIIKNRFKYLSNKTNEFRQIQILEEWEKSLCQNNEPIITFNMTASVSSGTYIREICNNIGKLLGIGGIALDIFRTKLDKYDINDLKNKKYIFI